jgi:hypothetical protein
MKNNFARSARLCLAAMLVAILACGPIGAVCGIIMSCAGLNTMSLLTVAFKFV